jgi:hypothetical protein
LKNGSDLCWEFASKPHLDSMLMDKRDIIWVRASYTYLFDLIPCRIVRVNFLEKWL